jgi:Tol biopolymer transport system component
VFSPDGTRIAFGQELITGGERLMIVNLDGSNLREALASGVFGAPDWSPDGGSIVFASTSGRIEVIHPTNGARSRAVSEMTEIIISLPHASPAPHRLRRPRPGT